MHLAVLVGQFWAMAVLALLLVIISVQLSYLVSSADALVKIKRNTGTSSNETVTETTSLRRGGHAESHSSNAEQATLAKLLKGLQRLGPVYRR